MSRGFYDTMRQIRSLPETQVEHAGEDEHPEMRGPTAP